MSHLPPIAPARPLRRVLILADETAGWELLGLRQVERLALTLQDYAKRQGPIEVGVWQEPTHMGTEPLPVLPGINLQWVDDSFLNSEEGFDLVLSTRLFLFRESVPQLLGQVARTPGGESWSFYAGALAAAIDGDPAPAWRLLQGRRDIPAAEQAFLRHNGKSQDGLVSRYLNRRISRLISRGLVRTRVTPSAWSVAIFILPILAAFAFLRGNYTGFVVGCAIFQLYSILDGCDGEIARAKFMQTDFGRRLDSFLDLMGNLMLALCLGFGLAKFWQREWSMSWLYIAEGLAAAVLIVLSEGIVFLRRTRSADAMPAVTVTRLSGALYQRHQEFLKRSGVLFFGEGFAWWVVQLTKRDMAMLAFLLLALLGWPQGILHLQFAVAGISSVLAGNAFFRQPAAVLPQAAG